MVPAGILPVSFSHPTQPRQAAPAPAPIATAENLTGAHGKLKFAKDSAGFLTELKRRVDAYFQRTGKSKNDCWQG